MSETNTIIRPELTRLMARIQEADAHRARLYSLLVDLQVASESYPEDAHRLLNSVRAHLDEAFDAVDDLRIVVSELPVHGALAWGEGRDGR